jgi:nitrogen fixation NifU-like protein
MDLKSLYRDVILDHYKKPRNTTPLVAPSRETRCKNPSCGDKITLQLLVLDGTVTDVAFIGNGCAISQASASMMTGAIKGKSLAEAESILKEFRHMVVDSADDPDKDVLGELITLQGIAKLHARVKCAMCGWSALEAALSDQGGEVDLGADESMPNSAPA